MTKLRPVQGYKPGYIGSKNMKPILPRISFSEKDLPEIRNWKVGSKYRIVIEVEQTALRSGMGSMFDPEYHDKKNVLSADFEVQQVGAEEPAKTFRGKPL